MKKETIFKGNVDYEGTMASLEVGDYALIPTSDVDISSIRSQVSKMSKRFEGRTFSVSKTVNGARLDRTA